MNHQAIALGAALDPASIAIVGASDNKNKVGGRPLDYLKRFGYAGRVYPVNPSRSVVQGQPCFPDIATLPEVPDLAIVAVAGSAVLEAVQACASKGIRAAIILSSGFGETGDLGRRQQAAIAEAAAAAGMRLIGPNSQGLANFSSGAVANFSTMFTQLPPQDGPVAIVSQSGATSAALYTLLRLNGVGVRYVLATGNEADVTVSELALAVAADPAIKLIVVYAESLRDADMLARAAAAAKDRGIPLLMLKAGRSAAGAAAAASHTGALINEDGVVDAFFQRHAIWRATELLDIVNIAPLYLKEIRPRGRNLVVVSNSGSSCVMCADFADGLGLPMAALSATTRGRAGRALASFATCSNPIDVATALLGDSRALGAVLQALADDEAGDLYLISLPVAGDGYDLEQLAEDIASFEKTTGRTVAVSATTAATQEPFRRRGLVTFGSERQALAALDQFTRHLALTASAQAPAHQRRPLLLPPGTSAFLSEAQSMAVLAGAGLPMAAHQVCFDADQAVSAWRGMGAAVAIKACSAELPHKSEHGLVHLNVDGEAAVRRAFEACRQGVQALDIAWDGAIVAKMARGRRELAIGGKMDPVFGPVIMVSDGGKYIEAMPDFVLLIPPFDAAAARAAIGALRVAPLFAGVRGEPPMDVDAICAAMVTVASIMQQNADTVASIDLNPVIVGCAGDGIVIADALIERRLPDGSAAHAFLPLNAVTEEVAQ